MKNIFKKVLLVNIFALTTFSVFAQSEDLNPISTAMPSLSIAPDARGWRYGGMPEWLLLPTHIHSTGILQNMLLR